MDDYERAVTEGALVRRGARGLVRLTGPQRVWFLQQTVTADVESFEAPSTTESFFLTPKGKVVAHFTIGIHPDEVVLNVDPPAHAELIDWFTKYRFRTKVDIQGEEAECVTVLGPPAAEVAAPDTLMIGGSRIAFGFTLGTTPGADVFGADGVDGLAEAPEGVLETLRIEAGIARFGVDYDTAHLPQEAGLTHLAPVDRGCYVGQETVARIHFRGHVNKVVRPLTFEDAGQVGARLILDGKDVGVVTSVALSPSRGPIGLGMVRIEPPTGTPLELDSGGSAVVGDVPEGTKTPETRP